MKEDTKYALIGFAYGIGIVVALALILLLLEALL